MPYGDDVLDDSEAPSLIRPTAWSWQPPRLLGCSRCGAVTLTREARCGRCGFARGRERGAGSARRYRRPRTRCRGVDHLTADVARALTSVPRPCAHASIRLRVPFLMASPTFPQSRTCDHFLPDLVVTDLELPEIDGLALIARLHKVGADVGIIAISGSARALANARNLGVSAALRKPVDMTDFIAVIRSTLRRRADRC
jgi:CheY-like chemotaxis protein